MRSHSVLLASNLVPWILPTSEVRLRLSVFEILLRNLEPGPTLHRKVHTGKARRAALELWQRTSDKRRCPVQPYRTGTIRTGERYRTWGRHGAEKTGPGQPSPSSRDASRRETPRFFVYQCGNTDISFRNSVGTSERFLSAEPTISRRNGLVHSNPPQVQSGLSTVTTGDRLSR
jgi:hypothetical protein